jgi:cytochrome b561
MSAVVQRYSAVAIVLHWAIASAIVLMIPLGFWMHEQSEHGATGDGIFRAYQLHKSIGLTILALSVVRLAWRLMNPPPALPDHMPGWERFAAKATHWGFYALMIGLPLSGWIYVSTGWSIHEEQPLLITTQWFGLFVVPHLFGLPHADMAVRESVAGAAMATHFYLAWGMVGLAALHIAAALKHQFFDRDEVMAHMVPGLRAPSETGPAPSNPVRLGILGGGLGLTAVALAAAIYVLGDLEVTPAAAAPEQHETSTAGAPPALAPGDQAAVTPVAAEGADAAAPAAGPAVWRVDPRASSIGFGFTFSDEDSGASHFDGRFSRWRADIRFDPNNLPASSARVVIEMASAADGVALHERNLPTEPWFNVAANPTATFRATEFRHRSGDNYEARGELTLRGRSRNVTLPFTLAITGDRAVMSGRTTIDRTAFGVGSDTEADDMISKDVTVSIHIEAARGS